MPDPRPIRFVATGIYASTDPEGKNLLANHRRLSGHGLTTLTPEMESHRAQCRFVKVGWNGAPIFEYTCPLCGIRWRNE